MSLNLDRPLRLGVHTLHHPEATASAPWMPSIDELCAHVELVDRCGYDSIWTGDHIAFAVPILDPLLQIAQAALASRRLLFGTGVYLLPLRSPASVAKMVATLDHLTEGRLIFGVGVGGEFPREFDLCGVPVAERGGRLAESIEVLRKLWSGRPVAHDGRYFRFAEVAMQPPARQPGGPPIWCGGRSQAALERAARIADGYMSYVVTPAMFAESLATIRFAAERAGRALGDFGTSHLLFTRLDATPEQAFATANQALSERYAMDFSRPTRRYAALGRPAEVADRIREFHAAGVRHLVLDFLGPHTERRQQIECFAAEAMPLLRDLTRR